MRGESGVGEGRGCGWIVDGVSKRGNITCYNGREHFEFTLELRENLQRDQSESYIASMRELRALSELNANRVTKSDEISRESLTVSNNRDY